MYPLQRIYSRRAFLAWQADLNGAPNAGHQDSALQVLHDPFWQVSSWSELQIAVSFLTMMNKRSVLYYRGQATHTSRCLPVLFRDSWRLAGTAYPLTPANRGRYYTRSLDLQADVYQIAKQVGTPRRYLLKHYPPAAGAVLQHYELWPTHMIDVTRSLAIALSFAQARKTDKAYLYVFAMPDLRGSVTLDMDQQLSIARLEAICPPAARRPHNQDAYLIGRIPEPPGDCRPGQERWNDWQDKSDLMRRLAAKFELHFRDGLLPGSPQVAMDYLLPEPDQDGFGKRLFEAVQPKARRFAEELRAG